jgi:multiple sugar transport system permease protein
MIISTVGAKHWKPRLAVALIYLVLILGAVTMIYPFLLMLAGSVKSEADADRITPYPEFWFNDHVLFQKYVESKHNATIANCRLAWGVSVPSWRRIELPEPVAPEIIADFGAWRETDEARSLGLLGHTSGARLLPLNARLWRKSMEDKYDGDLRAYCQDSGTMVTDWTGVMPPFEIVGRYRLRSGTEQSRQDYESFKAQRPGADLFFRDPQANFVLDVLSAKYGRTIGDLNAALGTYWRDWDEVLLMKEDGAPPDPLEADREAYLRGTAPLQYIRLADIPASRDAYHRYLAKRHGSVRAYNAMHRTSHTDFTDVPFVAHIDDDPSQRVEWEEFLRDPAFCQTAWISLDGPRERFLQYRRAVCGRDEAAVRATPTLGKIAAAVDYHDCMASSRELRKEFTKRNYLHVLDYIALHGNGIVNTLIYCLLAILTSLIVNPLAAYALSRFKLSTTYQILLFCMATMAFPGEVSMIPAFILMKRFPLWPLLGGVAAMAVTYFLVAKLAPRWRMGRIALSALGAGVLVGGIILPIVLGRDGSQVSLLNTFAALVLPGAANGYFIFLLKGFFDSMPRELYEAAELDGAGEWTKFWTLTINLSKPILAVIALGAFTGAYSAFMMALIIIPDPDMWTIMVWIFQLQSQSHGAVVYASIVLAALPTFLVFAFCQNLIIRGIVVPTEK